MIKKYWKSLIFSSLITLFPILVGLILWDRLPEVMPTHWGFDGQPDGWSSTSSAIFVMPLILLAAHWLCVFASSLDKSNHDKNEKIQKLVYWIIPFLSNLCCGLMYALALGLDFSITNVMMAAMGLMFVVIGNYMPKCKMNSTIGIKIYWTYTSEENWNATHRYAGKVWFLGGLLMLFLILVPAELAIYGFLAVTLILIVMPCVYSRAFYHRQLAQGVELQDPKFSRKATKGSLVAIVVILVLVAVLMFTGKIEVSYQEDYFTVKGTYYGGITVFYDVVDSVEYREGNVSGVRAMGWGSGRLLLGTFENEEFGYYTRYTYTNPKSCVVVTSGENVLVISGKTTEETKAIYDNLMVLTENN